MLCFLSRDCPDVYSRHGHMSASLSWRLLRFSGTCRITVVLCPYPTQTDWGCLCSLPRNLWKHSEQPPWHFSLLFQPHCLVLWFVCPAFFSQHYFIPAHWLFLASFLCPPAGRNFLWFLFLPTVLPLVHSYEETCVPWSHVPVDMQMIFKYRAGRCSAQHLRSGYTERFSAAGV